MPGTTENINISDGDDVFVFYCAENVSQRETYMVVIDPRHGSYRPRTGLTQGWVAAKAVHCKDDSISVRFSWDYFYTERGRLADCTDPSLFEYSVSDVRSAAEFTAPPRFFMPGGYCPKLAILSFRWGGKNEVVAPEQWGHTGSSCSNLFIQSFIESAVKPRVGRNYEVWTVFVEDQSDLVKLADSAHLIFGPHHPMRRAEHVCAMYFIYPTSFEENCVPTMETGEDEGAAHVDQKSLFRMMKAVEKAGVPTQFPHPSGFYELLTSKRWTHMMSLTPHLRVPPTVALPRMLVEKDIAAAAASARNALRHVKKRQALLRNEDVAKADQPIERGVAKLGFSWEALDVKFWQGEKGLEEALGQLTQAIEISGSLTGQPHDCESLLIQEYCEHDIELRLYVVNGKVEGRVYTKFCKIKPNNEFGDFHQHFDPAPVAKDWMDGDRAALDDGERQCRETIEHWMDWVQAQICDIPPAIRFDFFIGRTKEKGKAVIWTLEICELGFSMLGEPDLPRKVFEAMLHHCLDKVVDKATPVAETDGKVAEDKNGAKGAAKKPAQGNAPATSGAPGKADNGKGKGKTTGAPEVLYINMPVGNKEQKDCTGTYEITDLVADGLPVWRIKAGQGKAALARWIYHAAADNYWYVGDDDEKDADFNVNEGYIRCKGRGMPETLDDAWEYFDAGIGGDGDWVPAHEILVATEAEVLDAPPPEQGTQGAGKAASKGGQRQTRGGKGKRR